MSTSGSDDTTDFDDLDVAVAHWHINAWGGAEYLVTKLAEAVDVDRVYTLGEPDPDEPNPYGSVTFEDVTPGLDYSAVRRLQQRAGRLFEYAQWEDVDWRELGDPDVLVTSGATTRAVITPDDTLHVNYCHSPPRWFYDLYHDRKSSVAGALSRPMIRYLRTRDMAIDPRVDHYLVNSPIVERRLWKYYKRDSEVLYPPVELDRYYDGDDHGFYLHLGRLDEEKGVPAIVKAFEELDERLLMAGGAGNVDDSIMNRIEYAENIEWKGFVDENKKLKLLSNCTALVFNGRNEDFGIVPIEANASGKPVLVRDDGFPAMFVKEFSGGHSHDGTVDGIQDVVNKQASQCTEINFDELDQFGLSAFQCSLEYSLRSAYDRLSTVNLTPTIDPCRD